MSKVNSKMTEKKMRKWEEEQQAIVPECTTKKGLK